MNKEKLLADLHLSIAEELLRRVLSGEATSADLNVARGFLKDNGIDSTLQQSEPLNNLAESLPFRVELESA